MFKKTFFFCFLIILLLLPYLFSQYNNKITENAAPFMPQTYFANPYNPYSRGFAYNIVGPADTNSQLFKFDVGNPLTTIEIGSAPGARLSNGDFANPEGIWKFYVQDQYTVPYNIYEVDTATGVITIVGAPTNLKSGHKPRDLEWDQTTNTFYLISRNVAANETQLYSLYWPTKELIWIGPAVTTQPSNIQAGGFNINGTYFGIDIDTHTLWRVDKYTGTWTLVGSMGAYSNNSQDAAFDRSNYSRLLWCVWGPGRFYEVDTATGAATLIGNFPYNNNLIFGMGIAPYYGPQIAHTPLQNTGNLSGPYTVNAYAVSNNSGISSVKLFWSRNSTVVTDSITMTNSGGNNWTAGIPGNGLPAAYRYYIRATDSLARSAAMPYKAPVNLYAFNAMAPDTTKPVISHTPLGDIDIMLWPDTVNAVVTDNNGIDSVWVRWKINNGSEKVFKLSNTSGSNYSSPFNSTYADVRSGDTIKYRIIAQDNSINHVKDSTGLMAFRITPSSNSYICIGTGNVAMHSESPFNNFFPGFRTQMLWTASEINTNGGGGAGNIMRIAFYVLTVDTTTLRSFNLKMANTSYTSLTVGFVNVNASTVFSDNIKIQQTGWYYIDLQNPFYWDGVSSLIIETCFGNSNFVNNGGSVIQGTVITAMMYHGYREDSLSCSASLSGIVSSNSRPNLCFNIDHLVGMGNNTNNIPSAYNLYQNYPNPFNPVTRINFDVPRQSFVLIKMYDILGREVKTLVSEVKQPGSYSVDFNASGLPSGVYLYRMECSSYSFVKKMVLLK
jgi:hypothetical protein